MHLMLLPSGVPMTSWKVTRLPRNRRMSYVSRAERLAGWRSYSAYLSGLMLIDLSASNSEASSTSPAGKPFILKM